VRGVVRRIAKRTASTWDDRLIERKVFTRIAHVVPALIVYYGIAPALGVSPEATADPTGTAAFLAALTQRVALSFVVIAVVMAISAFLDAVNDIYNESYSEAKNRPIKGYLQVVGLVLFIAAGVIVVSILAGVRLATLCDQLACQRMVRVMPNTPCLIGAPVA